MEKYGKGIMSKTLAMLLAGVFLCGTLTACRPAEDPPSGDVPPVEEPGEPEEPGTGEPEIPDDSYPDTLFSAGIYSPSKAGMSVEYLGTVERRLPELKNGGLDKYPVYGQTLSATQEEKQKIFDENVSLNASASTYDSMDAEGNLYLGGSPTGQTLYKHTASLGMYEGDVNDEEPAIVKRLTIRPRSSGNHITGLYAPAGEVVRIEMREEDLAATGGLKVYIGQALANGGANNIWLERDFNRMPVILNVMTVSEPVSYVGSFLGGPVYIQPLKSDSTFTVTISGAVAYSHLILGCTTQEEFDRNRESTAPYFDLEVWDDAVRHSGPKARAEQFSYGELTDAAVLWDKIARVSNKVPAGSQGEQGIIFLYDPFIAAGSMVAFVGRHTVNCPLYCLTAALDADAAVDNASDAFWGCIHEFNHHFQRFGFRPGDEVTNNALSLVEYSLFTRISANRSRGAAGEGSYAVGWNRYTNPSWTLRQTLATQGTNSELDSYANLLHAFGQDAFIRAAQGGGGAGGADAWYRAVSDATGYDMTYYFRDLLHQSVSESVLAEYAAKDLPMFVPVSVIYQTGRSYQADGKQCFSRTVQPYAIAAGEDFVMDLGADIVLPDGFAFTVKDVTDPLYGTLEQTGEGVYRYTPSSAHRESGKIFFTLGITGTDGAFDVEDVVLVVELRQSQPNPSMLERTVYTYAPENMYTSVADAVANNYAGYETATEEDNENRVQNGNAEIWEPQPSSNAVMEIRGKFLIESDGKYRVALRGRRYAGLYLSTDGETYGQAATVENLAETSDFDQTNAAHYTDRYFEKGQWVYFKAVLLVTYARSFVGVGLGKFSQDTVNVTWLNAYRSSYEREPFETDYFYGHDYTYDYQVFPEVTQSLVSSQYRPWDGNYPIDVLFDDDETNYIHSDRTDISQENPFELVADLGNTVSVNTFLVRGEPTRLYLPAKFELYGGADPGQMQLLATQENAVRRGSDMVVYFPETKMRCYRLFVTDTTATTVSHRYIAFRGIQVAHTLADGRLMSPDEPMFEYRGNWSLTNTLSTFGHGYAGENASVSFTFTGDRFAVFGTEPTGSFEVLVDGREYAAAAFEDGLWISGPLGAGEHTVVLRSKTRFTVDSFVLWRTG